MTIVSARIGLGCSGGIRLRVTLGRGETSKGWGRGVYRSFSKPTFGPNLTDAALCINVRFFAPGQNRDKIKGSFIKGSFAKGLWHKIFQRFRRQQRLMPKTTVFDCVAVMFVDS